MTFFGRSISPIPRPRPSRSRFFPQPRDLFHLVSNASNWLPTRFGVLFRTQHPDAVNRRPAAFTAREKVSANPCISTVESIGNAIHDGLHEKVFFGFFTVEEAVGS